MGETVKAKHSCVQEAFSFAGKIKDQTKFIDRGCKIVTEGVKVASYVGAGCEALAKFAVYTAGFSTVCGLCKTIGHVKDFSCPDDKGVYNWQEGGKWGPLGTASNVLLTGADLLDPIFFLDKIGVLSLGQLWTPLSIAKNTILLGASVLGAVDNSCKLYKNDKALEEGTKKATKGKNNWQAYKDAISDYKKAKSACEVEGEGINGAELKGQMECKKAAVNGVFAKQIEMLRANSRSDVVMGEKTKHKFDKWSFLLTGKVGSVNTESLGDVDDAALDRIEGFSKKRIEDWTGYAEGLKHNHYVERTSNALGLTISICQLVLGIIGLVGVILSLASFGLAAIPILVGIGTVGWLATHILSFAKDIYCETQSGKAVNLRNMKDLTDLMATAA